MKTVRIKTACIISARIHVVNYSFEKPFLRVQSFYLSYKARAVYHRTAAGDTNEQIE